MNLIETMLSAGNGAVGQQLGSQFGLDSSKLGSVVGAVGPLLAHGLKEKLSTDPSGGGLLNMLKGGTLTQYADNPTSLATPEAAQQGQSILGSLFGGNSGAINTTAQTPKPLVAAKAATRPSSERAQSSA